MLICFTLEKIGQESTEQSLVAALQQGKQEALGPLYDTYAPVLLGLITRIVRKKDVAEAVLQEAFIAIWCEKTAYDASKTGFLSWIISLTRKVASDAIKTGKYNRLSRESEWVDMAPEATAGNSAGPAVWRATELCCGLEQKEKAALDLIYIMGYRCPEAAAVLGLPVETVKSNLKMATTQLRAGKTV